MATCSDKLLLRKPSELFRTYQGNICEILDSSEQTLESLSVDLFSKCIIDERTKNKVMKDKGYSGAVILVDRVRLKLEQNPKMLGKVFKIMHRQEALRSVVKNMQKNKSSVPASTSSAEKNEDLMETLATYSESGIEKNENKIVSEARALQDRFQDQLSEIRRQLKDVDIEDLQLRLNTHLSCEGENTPEINEHLDKVDQITEPSKILNYLIRNNMIGYLNYRLLYVFQRIINKNEIDAQIQTYEDAHDKFLQLTDLTTLAKVFRNNPGLAPLTHVGLPKFTVYLDISWEGKSAYQWNVLLDMQFSWPPHIHITHIDRGCIVIVYSVLPFFAPAVVRDLTDPLVLSLLEKQLGVIKVELTDQLIEMGKEEPAKALLKAPLQYDNSAIGSKPKEISTLNDIPKEDTPDIDPPSVRLQLLSVDADHQPVAVEELITSRSQELEHTPLHFAAECGKTDTVELLLKSGADVHKQDTSRRTPLHLAAECGSIGSVKLLLNYGADIHGQDTWKRTPLHLAAEYGRTSTVKLLLYYGADIHRQDTSERTPLHLAAESGRMSIVKLLLIYGADSNRQNTLGCTPLHLAAQSGRTSIVELLLKSGADIHKQDTLKQTPLHFAAECGRIDTVKLLVKYGADIHKNATLGRTPLHLAAESGRTGTVKWLLRCGADVHKQDTIGQTPLQLAIECRRTDTVELLLKYNPATHKEDEISCENSESSKSATTGVKSSHSHTGYSGPLSAGTLSTSGPHISSSASNSTSLSTELSLSPSLAVLILGGRSYRYHYFSYQSNEQHSAPYSTDAGAIFVCDAVLNTAGQMLSNLPTYRLYSSQFTLPSVHS